jgi:hypothetical protein
MLGRSTSFRQSKFPSSSPQKQELRSALDSLHGLHPLAWTAELLLRKSLSSSLEIHLAELNIANLNVLDHFFAFERSGFRKSAQEPIS